MRYYHVFKESHEVEVNESQNNSSSEVDLIRDGELVIDENTVYEIDSECIKCKKNEK